MNEEQILLMLEELFAESYDDKSPVLMRDAVLQRILLRRQRICHHEFESFSDDRHPYDRCGKCGHKEYR